MKSQTRNNRRLIASLAFLTLALILPQVAAAAPWVSVPDSLIGIFTGGLGRSLAILSCLALGVAAWMGKLSWRLVGWFIAGIVFVFGSVAIVDFFIAAAG